MNNRRKLIYSNLDYILLILTFICAVFGIIIISSATKTLSGSTRFVIIQTAAFLLGIFAMWLVSFFEYEYYGDLSKYIYIICVIMLVLVLFLGTGREDTGSRSWIRFGPIGIQPSEFVKIGFIITFAKHLSEIDDDINNPLNVLKLLIHAGILIGLIMLQPDFGTTVVFVCIFLGMIFSAGISYKYILSAIGALLIASPIAWFFLLKEYQKNRILVFLNPESDPLNAGYHVIQSKISIGSGQIFGKGLYHGTQTQLGYLPARHTDFIFAVIGEELGLIGCILVIALLVALTMRVFHISKIARNNFASYICVGVASMFIAHILENVGMCIGLMPVTGIPLPFFSYGGSSLITNMVAVGLVMNVYMRRKSINF